MTPQHARPELHIPVSDDAPRGILYPPPALGAEPMQASSSHQSTASAPPTQSTKPHLTIAEPEAVREPSSDPENPHESLSRSRRGSLATVVNAAASMNPMPIISSMWPSSKNDETRSQHSQHSAGDAAEDEGDRQEESSGRRWTTYVTPSSWWKPSDTDEEHGQGEEANHEESEQHPSPQQQLHSDQMVDYLDVIDPAVGVFNTLQDFGNSTMLPNIPWFYNRRPTLHIDRVVDPEVQLQSPLSPSPISPPFAGTHGSLRQDQQARDDEQALEHDPVSLGAPVVDYRPFAHEQGSEAHSSTSHRQSRPLPQPPTVQPQTELLQPPADMESRRPSTSQSRAVPSEADTSTAPMYEAPSSDGLRSPSVKPLVGDDSLNTLPQLDGDPHTDRWWDMDEEERKELDNHIRYLLTNKSKAKRVLKGFWNFVRTPMGFILTTYGLLITAWGMLIVLLAIPWVHVGDAHRQRYWIEICDQVLCALFAAVGLGFAPFRAVDTYRMGYIAHYHFLTYKRRRLLHLPELKNKNELPRYSKGRIERLLKSKDGTADAPEESGDKPKELTDPARYLEAIGVKHAMGGHAEEVYGIENLFGSFPGQPGAAERQHPDELQKQRLKRVPSIDSMIDKDTQEVSVLSPTEQATLQHQQRMFHASHTFYRYRETSTHWPFPLRIMMAIVILLDCHSVLQGTLGGVTWGIKYEHRPTALTATIISFSLSCNAMAGILIWQGGKRTRKTEVVERRLKLALEERAIERMERKRRKAARLAAQGGV